MTSIFLFLTNRIIVKDKLTQQGVIILRNVFEKKNPYIEDKIEISKTE